MSEIAATPQVTADAAADGGKGALQAAERQAAKRRWLLLTPAMLILLLAASGPLLIVLTYSFLKPGDYGGVVWQFSTEAWFNVFLQEDIFDETVTFSDAHLSIFWRSLSAFQPLTSCLPGRPPRAICGCF